MSTSSPISKGDRLTDAHQREVLDEFYREGISIVRDVLTPNEIGAIRDTTDRWIDSNLLTHLARPPSGTVWPDSLRFTQSIDRLFCDMLVREPILSLVEAVLGTNAGFVGQNVIRSQKSSGISNWHIDDIVEFPLPPEIPRHDPRIRMPVFWFTIQIALSDIDAPEYGPTEFVPGSHYSGRHPPNIEMGEPMAFEGRGIQPVLVKAGDIYLFNHQLWHRGSVNHSDRTRYLMQSQYCKAWGRSRFALPENNCALTSEQLAGASPRLLSMLRRD